MRRLDGQGRGGWSLVVAAIVVPLVLGLMGSVVFESLADEEASNAIRQKAAERTAAAVIDLSSRYVSLDLLADDLEIAGRLSALPGVHLAADRPFGSGVASARVAGGVATFSTDIGVGDQTDDSKVLKMLETARDSGAVAVSDVIVTDSGSVVYYGAAFYDVDGRLSRVPPAGDVSSRRSTATGYVVAQIPLSSVLSIGDDAGFALVAGPAGLIVGEAGTPPDAAVTVPLRASSREWTLLAWDVDGQPFPARSVASLMVGLVAAIALGAIAARDRRQRETYRSVGDEMTEQVSLIQEVAPVVQRSLDLAEVLPTVAQQLAERLRLSSVAVEMVSRDGVMRETFAVGRPVSDDAPIQAEMPLSLEAGRQLAVPLQRAGRQVGLLRVVPHEDLRESQLASLSIIAELATAAIVNAQLYEAQQDAVRQLRAVDDLKTVFLGTASHELRTPVAALLGFSRLLDAHWDEMDDENRKQFVTRIAANAAALDSLVQDLLDFSQMEKGRLEAAAEPIDASALVERVVDRLSGIFDAQTISASIEPGLWVVGDENGLERVVTNLLSNASKFSPDDSTILTSLSREGDEIVFRTDDEGPGVPVEERENIFSRFFRGGGQEVIKTTGAGIGLSVVAEFVELMGGTVFVTDAPSGGARFEVRLPSHDPATSPSPDSQTDDSPSSAADAAHNTEER